MNFTTCGMINKISQWYLFAQYDPSRQGHYYHKLFVWREKFSVGKCCLFRGWNTILPQFSFYHSANCSRLKILVILRNFPQSLQTLGFFTSNHSGKVFLANVWGGFVKKIFPSICYERNILRTISPIWILHCAPCVRIEDEESCLQNSMNEIFPGVIFTLFRCWRISENPQKPLPQKFSWGRLWKSM